MKKQFLVPVCALAFAALLPAQIPPPVSPAPPLASPTAPVDPSPVSTPVVPPSPSPLPTASPSPAAWDEREIERRIEQKIDEKMEREIKDIERVVEEELEPVLEKVADAGSAWAPMIIFIIGTVFLAPVLIVALLLFFSFWRTRQMHRTVRMLVEKGQPVPAELLSGPSSPVVKPRNDFRRGIILITIGLGVIFFFAGFDGPWQLGIIPLMIGVGYIAVSKLDPIKKDVPPPIP